MAILAQRNLFWAFSAQISVYIQFHTPLGWHTDLLKVHSAAILLFGCTGAQMALKMLAMWPRIAKIVVLIMLCDFFCSLWTLPHEKGEDMGFRMNPHLVERASLPRASASPASLFTATWPSARPSAIQRDRTPLQNLNVTQSTIYVQQNLHKATNDGNIYPNPSKPYNIVGNVWFEKYCQH